MQEVFSGGSKMGDFENTGPLRTNSRIAVFRALYLGDMLCIVPALRALRDAAPHGRIALIGLPWANEFCERFSQYIDEFVEFPGYPGLPEQAIDTERIVQFLSDMQARNFDLVLQMHGSGTHVNDLCLLLGAKRVAGFFLPGENQPDARSFLPYPTGVHEIRRHLLLLQTLGIDADDERLEFPLGTSDFEQADALLEGWQHRKRPFVCIHPGGKLATRRWPAQRFAEVANALGKLGYGIVLTGTARELAIVDGVRQLLKVPFLDVLGKTNLGTLAALIKKASAVITNDTGISHLTAAVGTPSVVVFLGSDIDRWAPLDRRLHRVLSANVDCRPCEHVECPIGFPCAELVQPETVLSAVRELLDSGTGSLAKPARRNRSTGEMRKHRFDRDRQRRIPVAKE